MILAHMQNLGRLQTFSNEFSGVSRVHQQLHMVCGIAHTQPQPKRIAVTRVMAKTLQPKSTKIMLVHIFCFVFPTVL